MTKRWEKNGHYWQIPIGSFSSIMVLPAVLMTSHSSWAFTSSWSTASTIGITMAVVDVLESHMESNVVQHIKQRSNLKYNTGKSFKALSDAVKVPFPNIFIRQPVSTWGLFLFVGAKISCCAQIKYCLMLRIVIRQCIIGSHLLSHVEVNMWHKKQHFSAYPGFKHPFVFAKQQAKKEQRN